MRDSVSFWVIDDRGAVGLPRIGIEAVAANWDAHDVQVNVAFPDGRVFRLRDNGASWPADGPDGRPTVLGAGGLGFRCIEPFDTWTMTFDGKAVQTSSQDLIEGRKDGPLVDVSFSVEATMAVPPWVQGALSAESGERLKTSIEGKLMGGPRYEQLFRATGTLKVGADEHGFTGTGLRIRRQGVRKLAGFWGHSWQSALFPSGRAFGYIAYPPRPDGEPTFNEGYLFDGDGGLDPRPRRRGALADPAETRSARTSRWCWKHQPGQCISTARRFCPPTTSITTTRCSRSRRSSRRCPASPRCSRPGCATGGTAKRPSACWSGPIRWTRSPGLSAGN